MPTSIKLDFMMLFYVFLLFYWFSIVLSRHSRRSLETNDIKLSSTQDNQHYLKTRAIGLCSGRSTLSNAIYSVEMIRNVWNSSISALIVHCDEIDPHSLDSVNIANLTLFNVCEEHLNLTKRYSRDILNRRLRSWWCKAAAVISLPYDEVVIVDLDVIWFNKPDLLFETKGYMETGALFFRDRVARDNRQMQSKIEALIMREAPELNITSPDVARFKSSHHHHNSDYNINSSDVIDYSGMSFFFNTILHKDAPPLTNHQDSSVIVVDRSRHPKLIQVLSNLIIDFNIGWGDKELYWISAIISDEAFAFEPFLIGSYGDCGYMIHYDPRQANESDVRKIKPFYINAEWLVNKVSVVGRDIEYMMSTPQLVRQDMILHDIGASHGCTFRYHGWVDVPFHTNQNILRVLWERLSRQYRHHMIDVDVNKEHDVISYYQKQCIPVYVKSAMQLSVMISESLIKQSLCDIYGCSYVPIPTISSTSIICVPVTFDYNPMIFEYYTLLSSYLGDNCSTIIIPTIIHDPSSTMEKALYKATVYLQTARSYTAGELIRFSSSKLVYEVGADGRLHGFPNLQTFVNKGYDFSNVIEVDDMLYESSPIGDMLPST